MPAAHPGHAVLCCRYLMLDACLYDDPKIVNDLYLGPLRADFRQGQPRPGQAFLRRFKIDLQAPDGGWMGVGGGCVDGGQPYAGSSRGGTVLGIVFTAGLVLLLQGRSCPPGSRWLLMRPLPAPPLTSPRQIPCTVASPTGKWPHACLPACPAWLGVVAGWTGLRRVAGAGAAPWHRLRCAARLLVLPAAHISYLPLLLLLPAAGTCGAPAPPAPPMPTTRWPSLTRTPRRCRCGGWGQGLHPAGSLTG